MGVLKYYTILKLLYCEFCKGGDFDLLYENRHSSKNVQVRFEVKLYKNFVQQCIPVLGMGVAYVEFWYLDSIFGMVLFHRPGNPVQ